MVNTITPHVAQGWYLENRTGNHFKFYLVLVIDNIVVTNWGRIGSEGQSKIQALPSPSEAFDIGQRQYYAKKARSYEPKHEDVKFEVDPRVLDDAASRQSHGPLRRLFWSAANDVNYDGDKAAVAQHYVDFQAKAQNLIERADSANYDEVYAEYEQLGQAWDEINEQHSTAELTVSIVKAKLHQRLMSGAL